LSGGGGVSTNPGLYPGNPSLPREVRDKILSTFKHTISLYHEGKVDDCVIGCDFILKMDPRFSPARRLLEKSKNPAADVDLIELEAIVATTPARSQRPSAADAEKLLVRAVESFNAREFDACIQVAEQVLMALPGNVHAADLIEKARYKKKVQGDFEASRTRALALLDVRRYPDAAVELDRMRTLDAEHPAVSLLERRIEQAKARTGSPAGVGAAADSGLGGMMDFSEPGGGLAASEPALSFDSGSGSSPPATGSLDSLSLDSLSLDGSSTAVPPPADFAATRRAPLDLGAEPRSEPGSPPDLWGAAEGPDLSVPESAPAVTPGARSAADEAAKGEREIAVLLKQGDDAAARGDYEGAIEIWSRIFLIDINSVEAVTRIEKAREDMSSGSQQLTALLDKGKRAFDSGDLDSARTAFLQALSVSERDATARSYLDRIEAQMTSAPEPEPAPMSDGAAADFESLSAEPAESERPAAPAKKGARDSLRVKPPVAIIAAAFVLLVAVGAWLVLRPSKAGAPPPAPGPEAAAAPRSAKSGGSLEKATAFFQEGKIPETIAELKRIGPTDPDYSKAKQLLESLTRTSADAGAPGAASAPVESGGGSPAADPNPVRARAERALEEKRYIDALKDFSAVSSSFPGDPAFASAMSTASEKVNELTPAVKLYNEGEYETAIPVLWRILQADRGNQDARSYLLRCYANQGITQLQNGLYPKALQSFNEALALDPQDPELLRHRKFAERYQKGDLDLLGRIYVRHLSHRP
jgi:tetratricopeptide (TPR) repeat protein